MTDKENTSQSSWGNYSIWAVVILSWLVNVFVNGAIHETRARWGDCAIKMDYGRNDWKLT